jgi:hypothetical protein
MKSTYIDTYRQAPGSLQHCGMAASNITAHATGFFMAWFLLISLNSI